MEDNDFVFAIPSYNRVDKQTTVNYLNKMGIEKNKIYVFVQTKEDEAKYIDKIGDKANVIYMSATRGVEARNNILNKLVNDYNILMLDDDIKAIGKFAENSIKKIEDSKDMLDTFKKCFDVCNKTKVKIFGVYPIYNYYFMENSISTKAPVNTIFGFAKGFKGRYNENYDTKEDAELCAKILSLNGSILRFNNLCVDADHRKNKNGYIDEWHQEENVRCVKKLLINYPNVYKMQKNKPWEVRCIIKDKKIKAK